MMLLNKLGGRYTKVWPRCKGIVNGVHAKNIWQPASGREGVCVMGVSEMWRWSGANVASNVALLNVLSLKAGAQGEGRNTNRGRD